MEKVSTDFKARLVALFNKHDDADRLVEFLDPMGKSHYTKAVVETILSYKKEHPKKQFKEYEQIRRLFLDRKMLERFADDIICLPATTHPVLLFPVRLETRFTSDRLLVRIYPDQISIHSHDESLTQAEYKAAEAYKQSAEDDRKHAWRILSSRFGPSRAAWLAMWSKKHDFDSDSKEGFKENIIRTPRLAALPDKYWVFAYRGNCVTVVKSESVRTDSTVIREFNNTGEGLFDENSRWMHDFDTALKDGFAVEIPLSTLDKTEADLRNGCDRVIAVGMKRVTPEESKTILEKLFDAHQYSSGLGFVESGTPTNNTNEVKSQFSSHEDHDSAYEIEIEGPSNWQEQSSEKRRTNAHRLADALGINSERLRYIEGAGSVSDSYAADMNTILWTVTGDYYLRYLLEGILNTTQLNDVRTHVREFVRGGGTLPTLRVGRQPYGVLPATRIQGPERGKEHESGWSFWDGDSNANDIFDPALHSIVTRFYDRWLNYANNPDRVPRISAQDSDPDKTLINIMSMEPHSVTYRARPFVGERFFGLLLAALRDHAFGPGSAYEDSGLSPEEWMAMWAESWNQVQERAANLLADLSGKQTTAFVGTTTSDEEPENDAKPLFRILAWLEGEDKPIEMVNDPNDETTPPEYLAQIGRTSSTGSNTLLARMACRALKLTDKPQSSSLHAEIKEALHNLASSQTLSFFNSVTTPEQIVKHIKDDPKRHPERDGYGVRYKLACRILEKREQLGGQFSSLDQIDDVYRVGVDTMHDILYTFRDENSEIDIDCLFRESLDIASHRVDAWVTSFAYKRLKGIREKEETSNGIHIGAYGFVEDLKPRDNKFSEGYIHAPSAGQAASAAVLYNAYLTHDPRETIDGPGEICKANPYHINLTSERVRKAMSILEGLRQGQPLGALVGFQFERALRDHASPLRQYIHNFREYFPLVAHKVLAVENGESIESVESVAARNVVDGVALIRDYHGEKGTDGKARGFLDSIFEEHKGCIENIIDSTADKLDAVGDLLLNESVYQSVQGNYERAGAALEAASGNLPPPEIESIKTLVSSRSMQCRVGMLFHEKAVVSAYNKYPDDPRSVAEPRIAEWFASLLGGMEDIGVTFEFWEEEKDPDILSRTNVNTASIDNLDSLPEIGTELAKEIIKERSSERGLFNQLSDLKRVDGIGEYKVSKLKGEATTGYVERVNINTASFEELDISLPITKEAANEIKKAPDEAPFTFIDDLTNVRGVGVSTVQKLRPLVTTGLNSISLAQCGLSTTDFLYIAQVPAEGAETEIEQRFARFVRDEFCLPASQRVIIHADQKGDYSNSLADAIELSRGVLDLLSTGTPMSPDDMCHPGDIENEGYRESDVNNLEIRVKCTQGWLDTTVNLFEFKNGAGVTSKVHLCLTGRRGTRLKADTTEIIHRRTKTLWKFDHDVTIDRNGKAEVTASTIHGGPPIRIPSSTDWEIKAMAIGLEFPGSGIDSFPTKPGDTERILSVRSDGDSFVATSSGISKIENALLKASKFGVPGAFPQGLDDPNLIDKFHNTIVELERRKTACRRLVEDAGDKSNNLKIKLLQKAMKAIFGKSFIVLPTFVPHHPKDKPDDLEQAFTQDDILNSLGKERLRLWVQQLSEVREPITKLENTLMMIEAWPQSSFSLALNIAQLPYTEGRRWLGLTIEEGAEEEPERVWTRSPLSLVVASHRNLPDFGSETAGILIDEFDDKIPNPKVNTSIAYQYDAPGAQAPQSLLLAVAGQMKDKDAHWTHEELAAIVKETANLAKVRAVDIDALAENQNKQPGGQPEPMGGIMPGIYLPTDPDRPGWAREIAANSIKEWLEELEETPCGCVTGTLNFPELTDEDGTKWILLPDNDWDMHKYARGIDESILSGSMVKVKGRVGSISKRIYVIDYEVLQFPDQFEYVMKSGTTVGWEGSGTQCLKFGSEDGDFDLQGGKSIEIGRVPRTFNGKVSYDGDIVTFELELEIYKIYGYKPPDLNKLWVDSSIVRTSAILTEMSLTINQYLKFGIATKEEETTFQEDNGASYDLIEYPEEMSELFGSKIWILEQSFDFPSGSSNSGIVTSFGLLREKDAIIECGETE